MSDPVGEAGKVASGAIDALKSAPTCLAALLFAALFVGVGYLTISQERTQMQERQLLMFKRCYFVPPEHAGKLLDEEIKP